MRCVRHVELKVFKFLSHSSLKWSTASSGASSDHRRCRLRAWRRSWTASVMWMLGCPIWKDSCTPWHKKTVQQFKTHHQFLVHIKRPVPSLSLFAPPVVPEAAEVPEDGFGVWFRVGFERVSHGRSWWRLWKIIQSCKAEEFEIGQSSERKAWLQNPFLFPNPAQKTGFLARTERLKFRFHHCLSNCMAAVAPCAFHSCACGQWNHLHAFHGARLAPHCPPVHVRLRQVLLEMKPFEEKAWDAQQLVQHMSADQVGPCVKAILEQPVPIPWMHGGFHFKSWDSSCTSTQQSSLLSLAGQRETSRGSSLNREMWMQQPCSFEICCGTNRHLAKTRGVRLASLRGSCLNAQGKTTCAECQHVLPEPGSHRSGRMFLQQGQRVICWWAARSAGWQTNMRDLKGRLPVWRFYRKKHLAEQLQIWKHGPYHWSSRSCAAARWCTQQTCHSFCHLANNHVVEFVSFVKVERSLVLSPKVQELHFDTESYNPCKVFAACPAKPIHCPIVAWALEGWGLPHESLDLLVQLGSSSSLVYCASLVLCWTTPVCTPPIRAGGFFPAGQLQKALPVSSHGFGNLGQ